MKHILRYDCMNKRTICEHGIEVLRDSDVG